MTTPNEIETVTLGAACDDETRRALVKIAKELTGEKITQKDRDEVWYAYERIERFAIVQKNATLWAALEKTKSALEDILDLEK